MSAEAWVWIALVCVVFLMIFLFAGTYESHRRLRQDVKALKVKWGQPFAAHESRLDALETRAGIWFAARMADRDREEPRRVS